VCVCVRENRAIATTEKNMTPSKLDTEQRLAIEVLDDYSSIRYDDFTGDGLSHVSTSDTNTNKNSNATNGQSQRSIQQPTLSQKETRNVIYLRRGVVIILVLSAATAGILSFWYLYRAEKIKFQTAYNDYAYKIGQSMYSGVLNTFATLDLLSTVMVTHAGSANETWPYTTLPNYANVVAKMLSQSAGITIWSMMLVNGTDGRQQWETYVASKQVQHVANTLGMMETDPNYYGTIPYDVPIVPEIHDGSLIPLPYNES
jgi:hypothetical protein